MTLTSTVTPRRELVERTRSPIAHSERVDFASDAWLDQMRAYLQPRVEERVNSLQGKRMAVCEIYTDAPPHLKLPNHRAAIHFIIDDGRLTIARGEIDDANVRIVADYNNAHSVATAVYEDDPQRKKRLHRETIHRHGEVFKVEGNFDFAPEYGQVLAGLHDYLSRRTVSNPDINHRLEHLGLQKQVDELGQQGYTIVENAISPRMVDLLTEDLQRLIAENGKRRIASMLLTRGPLWEEIAIHPLIYTLAQHMVGYDCNMGQSLAFMKSKGDDTHQMHNDPPHPLTGDLCCNLTTIWALDDFTETSGATIVVPGSHKLNCAPPADAKEKAIKLLMPKGSVAMWHGALWHGSAIREDEGDRLTIHNTYLRNWVRTFDNYLEVDPQILHNNPPAITTLCGVDDIYGKNTYAGPDFSRRK